MPLTDGQKAIRAAKRLTNVAGQQARVALLLRAFRDAGLTDLGLWTREFQFYGSKKTHPWRFDLACPMYRVAVEIDGGSYGGKPCALCGQRPGGRHSHGGREGERLKLNTAAAFGWRVLSFTTTSVERDPNGCAQLVAAAIVFIP